MNCEFQDNVVRNREIYSPAHKRLSICLEISSKDDLNAASDVMSPHSKSPKHVLPTINPYPTGKGYYQPPQAAGPRADLPPFFMEAHMNFQTLHHLYNERLPEIEQIIDMESKESADSDRKDC